ncbi:hypothetical protein [Streptosporangium sp. NPDC023615]|uniref:hypothetical protein n=1 Tax=Streptosporangium sp. NPDC023615 TaxID=3154794 RepID=UPI00341D8BE2
MALVDRDDVRELLTSPDPDATLIFVGGACRVVPADQVEGLVVVSRRELQGQLSEGGGEGEGRNEGQGNEGQGRVGGRGGGGAGAGAAGEVSDERLDELAHRLDTVVRELGG